MKRSLAAFVLLLAVCLTMAWRVPPPRYLPVRYPLAQFLPFPGVWRIAGSLPAPSVIQVKEVDCGSSCGTVTANPASPFTAGSVVVVVANANSSTPNSVATTCAGGACSPANVFKTWVYQASGIRHSVFVARNITGGTDGLSVGFSSGTSYRSVAVYEVANATAADVVGVASGSCAGACAPSVSSFTPSGSTTAEVIASFWENADYRAWTPGTGYTTRASFNLNGSHLGISEDNNTKTGLSGTLTASVSTTTNLTASWRGSLLSVTNAAGTQDVADSYIDFSGLQDGVTPTSAQLDASVHGVPMASWVLTGVGTMTGSAASQLDTFPAPHLLGATNWTGGGSMGLKYNTTGSTAAYHITASFLRSTPVVSWIGQFSTDIPQNDTNANAYTITQLNDTGAGADYLAPQIQANGSALNMKLECKSGASAGSIPVATNTLYYVFVYGADNAGTNSMKMFNSSGSQVGSELTCTAQATAHNWSQIAPGLNGAEPQATGKVIKYDNIRISYTGETMTP